MKAAVYTKYGPPEVLQLQEIVKPLPKDNEILIRIEATAVNSGDLRLRKADPFGVRLFFGLMKPKINILGAVFSGEVESIGRNVKLFKVGDEVFGHTDMRFGAHAEYICLSESGTLALKPDSLNHATKQPSFLLWNFSITFYQKVAITRSKSAYPMELQEQLAASPFN